LISAGAPPQTALGELTTLPQLYLKGPTSKEKNEKRRGREGKAKGKKKGRNARERVLHPIGDSGSGSR